MTNSAHHYGQGFNQFKRNSLHDNKHGAQSDLLNMIGIQQIIKMFDLLPNTLFWIKDTESRIIHANNTYIEHLDNKH